MEVPCVFYTNDWWPNKDSEHYTCQVSEEKITEKEITKFVGKHMGTRSGADIVGIRFDDCDLTFIPRGIAKAFPNLEILLIFNSKLTKLSKDDFEGLSIIKQLWISSCNIEYLPGNLFEFLPNLEILSIQTCNVRYIDAEILDCLPKLKVAKFNDNKNINAFHDEISGRFGSVSMAELKKILQDQKLRPPADYPTIRIPKRVSKCIKAHMEDERFKDLTISIDGEDFKVHKFIVAARSSVIANMILENPDAKLLKLNDIKKEIFEEVLEYIYKDQVPAKSSHPFNLFSAACRLGLEELKIEAIKGMEYVTADNALDMLIVGKNYKNDILMDKAFVEIKKMFPDKELKAELVNDTEKLRKMIEAKRTMDEIIQKARDDFENLKLFD